MMNTEDVKNKLRANLEILLKHFAIDIPDHLVHRLRISIIDQICIDIDNGANPPTIKWLCSWDCTSGLFPCNELYGDLKFQDIIKRAINFTMRDANR